ncbi:MAG TPA: HAMP domain-containing sensor histidine kinase [Friedmanniella sp.]
MLTRVTQAVARRGARIGVRARSVLVAVAVVSIALLLGGMGLIFALESSLERAGEAAARSRAAEIVSRIDGSGLPATAATLPGEGKTDAVTLVLAEDGRVVGSTRRATTTALAPQRPAVGTYQSSKLDLDTLDIGGEWEVVTTAMRSAGSVYYVQVAQSILVQRNVVQTLALFLAAGTPLLIAAVGLFVWVLVGRALRSVEDIRTSVADVDARRLATRLEVPPTRDEIAALATTMNAMLDRIQASDRAQRSFVSDASHELRSPLATLTTATELVTRTDDEGIRNRLLDTMNAELVRMRGLVANLMALARIDLPDAAPLRVDVDVDDLVGNEVRRLRSTSPHEVGVQVEPVRVLADPVQLAQALRNLVDNAERHALARVALTLSRQQDDAVIWVDNDGPVIGPADRVRVFERFVRLDDSRSRHSGGSGLGLAIARAGVVAQGGDVAVVDHPDAWCRFEIRIPVRGR